MRLCKHSYWMCGLMVVVAGATARADSNVTVSLVNPGSSAVASGATVDLEVRATFNTRLSAVAFTLGASTVSGNAGMTMTARSLNPTGANGLTYVSTTSQDPFESNLPRNLVASPALEVGYDNDFNNTPGSATDGLAPGTDVLIETITVQVTGAGMVSLNLSGVSAAHTQGPPNGSLFDSMTVGVGSITLSVGGPGDCNADGDVDLTDFGTLSGCFNGPAGGALPPQCNCVDLTSDGRVDLLDMGSFQNVFTVP